LSSDFRQTSAARDCKLQTVRCPKPSDVISFATLPSPLGDMLALADNDGLITGLYFSDSCRTPATGPGWARDEAIFDHLRRQLDAYFTGQLTHFDLPLCGRGTEYQQRVWAAVAQVAYGQTVSYGALARQLGTPRAARAVGLANARNPISIVVPCHRVIGSNGALVGYAAGRERKQWLLAHEAARPAEPTSSTVHDSTELTCEPLVASERQRCALL
jgi:methylated-DNA-[protein]-cysteine S-methyltransferase